MAGTASVARVRRAIAFAVVTVLVSGASLVFAPTAEAFKPYTHSNTGFDARADATDNGMVTINGREYPVNPAVVAALQQWPSYYNAGVIGPDGFPDLTMGQSIIHPVDTGRWLKYILDRAWAAQTDPTLFDRRERSDPRLRLRIPHPRGRRHVGAHAHQRTLGGSISRGRRHSHERQRRVDRDPPHHRGGLRR